MCRICLSPYREELMRAWNAHFPRRMLYEKYKPLIWQKKPLTEQSFLQACFKHKSHKPPGVVVVQAGSGQKTTEGIAKMITELFARKVETMGPDEVTTKDYLAAHKVVQDEQKLSLDKNAQMLEFAKIFGLPDIVEPIIGEETHAELGPAEDEGNQPKSP